MSLLNHEEVSLDIMKQLEGLLNEINEIKTKKLHELIESNESGVLDGLKPIERYLIRQGYLDGTYADYLSYYLGQSYSPRDYQFLRRVVDRRAATFEYSIDQPDKVLASLNPAYFYKPVTLNNNLLDYILQHAHEYTEQQENIIRQIRREKRVDFIQQYLERGKSIIAFIMEINHSWPQVWTEILESERFTLG